MSKRLGRLLVALGLPALLLLALAIRLYDLNWDDNHHIHPDERFITLVALDTALPAQLSDLLDLRHSALNPYWDVQAQQPRHFAYGSFPLYLLRLSATALGTAASITPLFPGWADASDYDHLNLVGRVLSAVFDTLTIALIFLLGRRIYNKTVGFIAAALLTFTVQHIQLAHFYAFDVVTTTTIVAALYFGVRVVQDNKLSDSLALGAMVALAVASKFSALPLLLVIVLAHSLRPILSLRSAQVARSPVALGVVAKPPIHLTGDLTLQINQAVARTVLSLLFALLVFAIVSPFTFIDFNGYASSISEQSDMVRGILDYPYTRQYRNTGLDYWFNNLVFWALGPALGFAGLSGLGFVVVRLLRRVASSAGGRPQVFRAAVGNTGGIAPAEMLVLAWVLPYGLITLSFQVKFLRYLMPLAPFLCLMAAYILWRVAASRWRSSSQANGKFDSMQWGIARMYLRLAPLVIVIGATVLYAYAFMHIYTQPLTRVSASDWIYRNIPAGATLTDESWDDSLPFAQIVDGRPRSQAEYKVVTMDLVEPDDASKLNNLRQWMNAADYIVISSNRMYGWLPRLADRFPLTKRYYDLLFSEKLGYQLAAQFATYPQLGPWTLNDDHSDESFTVYDHPKVLIYRKTRNLGDAEFNTLFAGTLGQSGPAVPAVTAGTHDKSLLLDRPVDQLPVVNDRAWNPIAATSQSFAIFAWWLVVELLGLLALPLALDVFHRFSDGGYIFAKSLGLLVVGFVVWIIASFHLVIQNALLVWAVTLLLVALAIVALIRQRGRALRFLWERRRIILFEEILFTAAFALFVCIRILDPDLWQPWNGGEKTMEFAFLNAILKSPYFPPYDPFFAGGYINYYYYGLYLVGILIKLTGIASEVAFNLAVPTLFAFTVVNAFGVAFNLTNHEANSDPSSDAGFSGRPEFRAKAVFAGLLAAFFIAGLGNLDGFMQIVEGLGKAAGIDFQSGIIGIDGLVKTVLGTLAVVADGKSLPLFDYWRSSRVIPYTINEFPLWSFLFSDLHPHMIGIPFTLLAIAMAAHSLLARPDGRPQSVAAGTELDGSGELMTPLSGSPLHTRGLAVYANPVISGESHQGLAQNIRFGLVFSLTLGAIAVINTWDAPTYLGLGLGALLLSRYWSRGNGARGWLRALAGAAMIGALSLLLYWPFFSSYKALYVGLGLTDMHTDFQPFVVVWGFFLFVSLTYVAAEIARRTRDAGPARLPQVTLRHVLRLPRVFELLHLTAREESPAAGLMQFAAAGLVILCLASVALLVLGLPVIALLLWPFCLSAALLLRRNLPPRIAFMNWLAFWAFAILLGVEIVYLQDFLGAEWKRMNTIFKFYIQAWVLLGLLAAIALPELWMRLSRRGGAFANLWKGAVTLLVAACMVFTFAGTAARVNDRFPGGPGARPPVGTLDGLAFMGPGTYNWPDEHTTIEMIYDLDAIRWLQANVVGTPVIAEADIGYYREGGLRVSAYTGLPTLLGMHQSEQRYADDVGQRDGEARDFFTTPDSARAMDLIRELHISYIYVGQLERVTYDAAGLAKFDAMLKAGVLDIAYQNPRVMIYRVRT